MITTVKGNGAGYWRGEIQSRILFCDGSASLSGRRIGALPHPFQASLYLGDGQIPREYGTMTRWVERT